MTLYCFFWPVRFIDGARDVYCPAVADATNGVMVRDEESLEKIGQNSHELDSLGPSADGTLPMSTRDRAL